MAIEITSIISGFKAFVETAGSLRITQRPNDTGALGSYSQGATSVAFNATPGNATLYSFRWTDPSAKCVVRRISARLTHTNLYTAVQEVGLYAQIARSWTTTDAGGSTLLAPTKRRSSMAASLLPSLNSQILAFGPGLTVGTRTSDGGSFASTQNFFLANTVGTVDMVWDASDQSKQPIVLVQNEGIVISNLVTLGNTGGHRLLVNIEWDEMASY
jgi:hypothetical protein